MSETEAADNKEEVTLSGCIKLYTEVFFALIALVLLTTALLLLLAAPTIFVYTFITGHRVLPFPPGYLVAASAALVVPSHYFYKLANFKPKTKEGQDTPNEDA